MINEILAIVIILFFSIILHEYAHGWVAYKFGDSTAKQAGRLTLNPLKHIDPVGTVLLPGILITLRAMGINTFLFGWAKPVPVNFYKLRNPKRDMMWVGLAGPAVNIILAILCSQSLLWRFAPISLREYLLVAIFINLLLAIFNMIPIPPLDGSRLVMGLLPKQLAIPYARLEHFGIPLLIFFLIVLRDKFALFDRVLLPIIEYLGNLLGVSFRGVIF